LGKKEGSVPSFWEKKEEKKIKCRMSNLNKKRRRKKGRNLRRRRWKGSQTQEGKRDDFSISPTNRKKKEGVIR